VRWGTKEGGGEMSGKVVVNRCMSLDGFIAGPGHSMDWGGGRALADFEAREDVEEVASATGAMLVGRRTWEVGDQMAAEDPGSNDYPFSGPMFLAPTWPASACRGGLSTRSWCMCCRCSSATASASRPRVLRGQTWNR